MIIRHLYEMKSKKIQLKNLKCRIDDIESKGIFDLNASLKFSILQKIYLNSGMPDEKPLPIFPANLRVDYFSMCYCLKSFFEFRKLKLEHIWKF
jgi:hypothetical protein